jgi:hypothetical protein
LEIPYRIKELVGVASLAKLGKEILTSSLEHDEPGEKMVDLVSKLSEVNWEKTRQNAWVGTQAGFAGQVSSVQTVPQSKVVQGGSQQTLGIGVATPHAPHAFAPLLPRKRVCHTESSLLSAPSMNGLCPL